MDCEKVLMLLTKFHEAKEIGEDKIKEVLSAAYSAIPDDILNEILNKNQTNCDIGCQYLHILLHTTQYFLNTELTGDNPLLTVNQLKILKLLFETIASIGIIPSLLPQIKIHATNVRSRTFTLKLDENILEKYKRLSKTVDIFLLSFEKVILRPALVPQMDCLLAALLQLSYAPLMKPVIQSNNPPATKQDFVMTTEVYNQLKQEQENFCQKLQNLIENCPQSFLIKELMVILAIKNNPKWLQINIKNILTNRIMQPNGIGALTVAICEEVSDIGKCWDKLDVTARLIATSHGSESDKYYDSVCFQILELLTLKNNKQGVLMANCFIKALYDNNQDVCIKKILNVVMEPLLVKSNDKISNSTIIKTEEKVSECIENLCKLFLTTDTEFKCLPLNLLTRITLPLFYLYCKTYKSIYVLRSKVQQLILKTLADESIRETMYSAFLNHQIHHEYGDKLNFRFAVNGGIEITSETLAVDNEELADCLYDLVSKDASLSFTLFTYLLKVLPKLNDVAQDAQKGKLLETTTDVIERIEKQITAVKLLTLLSSSALVQEAQMKNPEQLLEFIEFFFSKIISNSGVDESTYEQDTSILYTSLMLIKIMLTEKNISQSWKKFEDFINTIKEKFDLKKVPSHINSVFEEIEDIVKKKGKSLSKRYYDLSVDSKNQNEFDKAIADLADPLLPVRAHGIIALTKLIETRHPDVTVKKDFLLCLFQENLNHEESFIYLAAINGICALSSTFPDKVIEILVQEFIGMTQQIKTRDIPPETRVKLGEILVKTTRALGEMTPKYKSLLVNGFLCGTRDPDALVRASSLSCLGEFCKIMGYRLGNLIIEILYCISCIIKTDKDDSCRRAGVLVSTLLLRGLGKDALIELGENLVTLYRSLKHLRDHDKDPVLQLHAQVALEEFDDIVQQFLFTKPKLEKSIFLLPS